MAWFVCVDAIQAHYAQNGAWGVRVQASTWACHPREQVASEHTHLSMARYGPLWCWWNSASVSLLRVSWFWVPMLARQPLYSGLTPAVFGVYRTGVAVRHDHACQLSPKAP
jgi:hypothetical protein